MLIAAVIAFFIGLFLGYIIRDGKSEFDIKNKLIDDFKKSAEFSRILDDWADYKLNEHKRLNSGKNAVNIVAPPAIDLNRDRPKYDFSDVEFSGDIEGKYSQEEILKFKENRIPSEWLKPMKIPEFTNQFTGKKIVITGDFSFQRNFLARQLWKSGADLDTAITARTELVIKGDNAGWKKSEQIEAHSIRCISEEEIIAIFPELKNF